jgi:aryl-alcohol dehydrogenase-like predicted oxidoreductase
VGAVRNTRLGKSELEVSVIAFGTWSFGGEWGAFDAAAAKETIHRALDLGITLFDTAQGYGFGASESVLADALWERARREDVIVATKGGLRKDGNDLHRDASARWLREGVESSLRNLRTDYIDLYQIHWPDVSTPAEETGRALEALVREGKIRHVGVSNYDVKQIDELSQFGPVETLQPPYHMFRRDIETEILPYVASHDIGVLVYGPLAHGLLSGGMSPRTTFTADDWRSHSPDFSGERFARNLEVVERLDAFARERGISLPQLAVAWTLSHPAVQVAIVGARHPEHLNGTAAAGDIELSEQDMRKVGDILADAVPDSGPSPEGM